MNIVNKIYRREEHEISRIFFSDENMKHLHSQIVKQVFYETKIKISKQSDMEVLHMMSNMYNLYGSTPKSTKKENGEIIMDLNYRVIREATDNAKSGILMYVKYLNDASTLPEPLDRAKATTNDRSLEMTKTFFNESSLQPNFNERSTFLTKA